MDYYKRSEEKKCHWIITLISLPFVILSLLFISWLFSLIVEVVCMTFVWQEDGSVHSQAMLAKEITMINASLQRSLFDSQSVSLAVKAMSLVNGVFEWTGFNALIQFLGAPITEADSRFISGLRVFFRQIQDYVVACINMTLLFSLRVVVVTLSLPLFILVGIGAVIDGLVQRDLRKFGGGNESAWLYHKVKRYPKPILVLSVLAYLSMPVSVHPNLVFMPAALLLGLFVYLSASRFKKYI